MLSYPEATDLDEVRDGTSEIRHMLIARELLK
jgi:hypothetical protein